MKQLNFHLKKINAKATRKAVESLLEDYKILLLTQPVEALPKVTASYTITPPSNTNEFHSTTESTAIDNLEREMARRDFINKIIDAVNRLSPLERKIIIREYMSDEELYNYEIYNELGISESKYYKVKSSAFYKLAFILKVEVYHEKVNKK